MMLMSINFQTNLHSAIENLCFHIGLHLWDSTQRARCLAIDPNSKSNTFELGPFHTHDQGP